jgi:CTP:molybdopterin cytidylyltransferase MocA
MEFSRLVAIVLAGNDEDAGVFGGIGQTSKFFMPFGSELVGHRIIRALDGLPGCSAICVAVPPALVEAGAFTADRPLRFVLQGEMRSESMANAAREAGRLGLYPDGDHVLVVTGDLPLLEAAALERFVAACRNEPGADCYVGMIPLATVDPTLRRAYEREVLPFRGGQYLHSDVYLVRLSVLTGVYRERFEQIMTIRRAVRGSRGDILRAALLVLGLVGLRGVAPFARAVMGNRAARASGARDGPSDLDRVERVTLELMKDKLGLGVNLMVIEEPTLALGFDYAEELQLLESYAMAARADSGSPA